MNKELLERGENLWKKYEKVEQFAEKLVYPVGPAGAIYEEFELLNEEIPAIENPKTKEELYTAEFKRRISGEALLLGNILSGRPLTFSDVVRAYSIDDEDITQLRPWLDTNREKTFESINRLFHEGGQEEFSLSLPTDLPHVASEAEAVAAVDIRKYHKRLSQLFTRLTHVGEYLRDITAVPTRVDRSYFHSITKNLAISINTITYITKDGSLETNAKELIRLLGHEGMGHALNQMMSENDPHLPFFLKESSASTIATAESVAQFYEREIFEDLKDAPKVQYDLGIPHKFNQIYQEVLDSEQIDQYKRALYQYAITVMADKSLGDPRNDEVKRKKAQLLSEVSLVPWYPSSILGQYNDSAFDYEGNLNARAVGELRYCAKPVQRALVELQQRSIEYASEKRSEIDSLFLRGFWTPIGFVQNAKISL